jgi:murein DD-endopeptidase
MEHGNGAPDSPLHTLIPLADFKAILRRITDVSDWFQRNGHEVAVRGLDREALARLAAEGKTRYGLDPEFSRYMELGE